MKGVGKPALFDSGNRGHMLGAHTLVPERFRKARNLNPERVFDVLRVGLGVHLLRSHCLFAWPMKSPEDEPDKRGGAGARRDTN